MSSQNYLPSLPNGDFVGVLLLHIDETVSTVTSHFLQKMIMQRPALRYFVSMVSAQPKRLKTVLSRLL